MYVKDVEDRSNTPKGCNAMYVEDVEDRSNTPKNAMYVKDVEDRSNTPKGCNAMYVEDVEDNQIHLRAVMLCMSKMSKIVKCTCHVFQRCQRWEKNIHKHFGS